jgi:tetratricopeptide (TPR) repeat protein
MKHKVCYFCSHPSYYCKCLIIFKGNTEKALKVGYRALEITEATLGPDDPNVSSILIRLGRVLMRELKYKEAKAYFKRALAIVQTKLGPEHPQTADNVSYS